MNIKAAFIALLAFGLFSSHDVVVKYLGEAFSPLQIIFFSSLMSFPLLTMMMVQDPTPGNLRPVHPWWVTLRSICAMISPACAFFAFILLPLAQAYALLFATPLLITLLSIPVLNERVGAPRLIAVAIGLCGVLVVVRPGSSPLSWGHFFGIAAALSNALQSITVRKIGREERHVVLMLYPLLLNVVLSGIALIFVYEPMQLIHLGGIGIVAFFGFAATLMMVYAYTVGEAAFVAPMQYSQILWAMGFGYILFGEIVDLYTLLGSAIIVFSGLFIIAREAFGNRSEHTPVLRSRSRGLSPGSFSISLALRRKQQKNLES